MWRGPRRTLLAAFFLAASVGTVCPLLASARDATVQRIAVLGAGAGIEVEIVTSQAVAPQAQAVTGPNRIVIDFPNSVPNNTLRGLAVSRGQLKGIRIGLFSAKPPVTRVVLDLKSAQAYEISRAGNRVMVKLGRTGKTASRFETQLEVVDGPASGGTAVAATAPPRSIEVEYHAGQLRIWADKVSMAELLREVRRKTGADIPVPAGAEQELVVVKMGPAPVQNVLAELLNGSRFNFIIVGSKDNPARLHSLLLSPKAGARPFVSYPSAVPVARGVAPPPAQPEEDPDSPQDSETPQR